MPVESIVLTANEARVLASLLEKESTTPEYYPLSLNALVNACNQRSNREPVMTLDEEDVRQALHGLESKELACPSRSAEGRVAKYEHHLGEVFNFSRAEAALICTLLLRGPQTPGELRGRSERLHRFDEIADVIAGLQKLIDRDPPVVAILPRQPGTKESRYAHLLSGPPESITASLSSESARAPQPFSGDEHAVDERISALEQEVNELRQQLSALQEKIDNLFGN